MNRFLQFFRLLPALIFILVMCTSCEDAGGDVDEIPIYTVTFETNGGSAITAVKVESGSKISQPVDPTKDGETFVGWYSDVELTEEFDFNEAITSDITLYASWLVNTLTITFDSCGGSEVEPQTIDYDTTIAEPEAPIKDGYSFVDWYSDALLTNLWSFTTKATTDMTLYAKWSANQYTITFETNGGTEIAPFYAEYESTITMPDNPTKEGYSFVGWYNDADLSEAWDVNTKITSDITLYAQWSTNQYTVTFESNGGSSVSSQTVAYDEMATEPTEPTKTGCSFEGWYSDSALTITYNFNTAVTENITLYAKWSTNQYSVSFESNGGSSVTTQYVDYGATATEPTAPTKNGYTFAGWHSDSALTSSYNFNTAVTENITLYAKWSTNQYTVSFESNGGSSITTQYVDYGSTATEPTSPTKTGYTFAGWYSDSTITTAYNFSTAVTENIMLYAKWSTNQYSVSFESNGGSSITNQYVDYGSTATEPTSPTKTGYSFAGWYSDSILTTAYNFSTAVTENITLYAKWSTNQYTVSFESNGGSSITTQYVDYGSTATEPTSPTKTGYTFAGWYSDSALTAAYNFNTAVTENITLYAKWSTNQYSVSFESNGGSSVTTQYVDYNTTATEPTSPTKTGYTFAGWYSDSALIAVYNFNTAVTENITLYTKWTTNTYTVTFESNGGSTVNTQTIDYNTTATEPTSPTKTGYTFAGWYSDSALTAAYNFNTAVTNNITLYAKWTINQYTITFNSNGGTKVDDQLRDYNTSATEPTAPTRTGYTFAGWYSDSALTAVYNFNTAVTENITLYAKWTINTYTVTFESNGGSTVTSQTVNYSTTATEPTAPTRTGYTFAGWYSDSALTQEWSFDTNITTNTTIYAKWVSTSGELPDLGTGSAW